MRIKPIYAIIIVLGIFIAGIFVTSVTGLWSTKSTKVPSKLDDVQYSQSYDPADIRGSYTFSEISSLYGIQLEDLAAAFGISEGEAAAFKCKDLETISEESAYEIGTGSVRLFTAYYLGLPYTPTEETYLSETAAQILKEKGGMTQEQSDYLEGHTVPAV